MNLTASPISAFGRRIGGACLSVLRYRLLLLASGIVLLLAGIGLSTLYLRAAAPAGRAGGNLANLLPRLLPAVVNITAITGSGRAEPPAPLRLCGTVPGAAMSQMPQMRDGSGFIIDPAGFILTNRHVVESADSVTVTLQDNTVLDAKIVGVSPCDLALLKVNSPQPLSALRFGNSDRIRVGDPVVAVGNALSLGTSVSVGIVSALHRDISDGPFDNFIQTDAPINHGNSGGPLLDIRGEVIGVDTAIVSPNSGSVGLGFAFPSNDAKFVADQLRKDGRVRIGSLGMMVQQVTPEIAEALGLEPPAGALVAAIEDEAPTGKGVLQPGDVITAFDRRMVPDDRAFVLAVAKTPIGERTSVAIWRDGTIRTVPVTVAEWAEKPAASAAAPAGNGGPMPMGPAGIGWRLAGITEALRSKYGLAPALKGVLIVEITPGSVAGESELAAGDVILEVQRDAVAAPEEVRERLEALEKQRRPYALILVQGDRRQRWIALHIQSARG